MMLYTRSSCKQMKLDSQVLGIKQKAYAGCAATVTHLHLLLLLEMPGQAMPVEQ